MIFLDLPRLFERPRHLVLAFMAGLSTAAGRSGRCYFDALVIMLPITDDNGADA